MSGTNETRFKHLVAKIAEIQLLIRDNGFKRAADTFGEAADREILEILNRAASPRALERIAPTETATVRTSTGRKPRKLSAKQIKFFQWNAPITFGSAEIAALFGVTKAKAAMWLTQNQNQCVTRVSTGVWKRKPAPSHANPGHTAPSPV